MKIPSHLAQIFLLIIITIACSDNYFRTPMDEIKETTDEYVRENGVWPFVVNCYANINNRGFLGTNYQNIYHALDDRVIHENTELEEFSFTANESSIYNLFSDLFNGVYHCNEAIKLIKSHEEINSIEQNYMLGEVSFIRALFNFNLTRSFNAPPLISNSAFDPLALLPNADQASFYQNIISDLETAIDLLPEEFPESE